MKKPLILLIDDDAAVLSALEAVIEPAFGEIARVEAFDNPALVLEMAQQWEEEERPVALAICDQKMPKMMGVECLQRLRALPAAEQMRSILLTGFAGLESAIEAINTAAVDFYMEKPWNTHDLIATAKRLLRTHLEASDANVYFEFREILEDGELRSHLALRQKVYRTTTLSDSFLSEKAAEYDVDKYDRVARFFGIFMSGSEGRCLIGTLRVAGQEPGPAAEVLAKIVDDSPDLSKRVYAEPLEPIPLLEYLVDRDAVRELIGTLSVQEEQIVEPSRLAVDPAHRVVGGIHLAKHMIEGAVGFFAFFLQIEHAILACDPPHRRLYHPYGFAETEGTRKQYQPSLGRESICLHGRRSWVPAELRELFTAYSARITRTGGVCRCRTFPMCVPDSFEAGCFSGTDLFCPFLAEDLLGVEEAR